LWKPAWSNKYTGIAPNAKFINLRFLNSSGTGKVSYVLAALDWIYANRNNTIYNIKVVNMSLGTPTLTSYRNDQLCQAVRNWLTRESW
jgi:serine protease AprX